MVHPRPQVTVRASAAPWPTLRWLDWFTSADSPGAPAWHRSGRLALALMLITPLIYLAIGFVGPSIVTLDLGPRDGSVLPPWNIDGPPALRNEWVVTAAVGLALSTGTAGLLVALRALAVGWLPRLRRCYGLGIAICVATVTVPPLTSADVLMYSAYGRIAVLGMSPYAITPGGLFRTQYDPILRWTEGPWQDTPSVYGPILNWIQIAANRLGGETVHDVVFWLQWVCMIAMIVACTLTIGLARNDRRLQARVIMLSILNPILIWAVVVSAHNEAIAVAFGIGSFYFLRRRPFIAGLLIGIGCSVKATLGLYGIAMIWAYRRDLPAMARAVIGAGIPSSLAYFVLEPEALTQAARNSGYLSEASWLAPIQSWLTNVMDTGWTYVMVSALGWTAMIVIAWMLSRVLPHRPLLGLPQDVDPRRDPLSIAIRTSIVLTVAWLVTAPYSLPWYDLATWLPLALYGATRLDLIMLIRGYALNIAFNPGRTVGQSELMEEVVRRIRLVGSTTMMMGVIVMIVLWWYVTGRQAGSWTRSRCDPHPPDAPATDGIPAPARDALPAAGGVDVRSG